MEEGLKDFLMDGKMEKILDIFLNKILMRKILFFCFQILMSIFGVLYLLVRLI
jgi:hypothetical protein